jgi:hypothetical protein
MPTLTAILQDGTLAAGAGAILYSATISTAALVALLAPNPERRRDARDVLTLLLRRPPRSEPPTHR